MKNERLYVIDEKSWCLISDQYSSLYRDTFLFVTENKGTNTEALDVYIESFLYYTQLLELHGMDLIEKGADIIYSFARCIWVSKLRKRNVDVNFVVHKRSYFEMEDAFHEIDLIAKRSEATAEKLASVGEPSRTLILEHIGQGTPLNQLLERLSFSSEERASNQLISGLHKLIKLSENKDIHLNEEKFAEALRVLEGEEGSSFSDKVSLTVISRTVAMVKNHVTRSNRIAHFKELSIHTEAQMANASWGSQEKTGRYVKLAAAIALACTSAVIASLLTAFGVLSSDNSQASSKPSTETKIESHVVKLEEKEEPLEKVEANFTEEQLKVEVPNDELEIEAPTSQPELDKPEVDEREEVESSETGDYDGDFTAFAISSDGYLITTADAVAGKSSLRLAAEGSGMNIKGRVVFADKEKNLALLKCQFPDGTKVPFRLRPEAMADCANCFLAGFDREAFSVLAIDSMDVENAFSGSPVFGDYGQVAGMIGRNGEFLDVEIMSAFVLEFNTRNTEEIELVEMNGLFYSDQDAQIRKVSPFIWKIRKDSSI